MAEYDDDCYCTNCGDCLVGFYNRKIKSFQCLMCGAVISQIDYSLESLAELIDKASREVNL